MTGAGAGSGKWCRAGGPGLEGMQVKGEKSEFWIVAADKFGNRLLDGGLKFVARANQDPVTIKDNKDGSYSATYSPSLPGRISITIDLDNSKINGSPFKVDCKGAGISAAARWDKLKGLPHLGVLKKTDRLPGGMDVIEDPKKTDDDAQAVKDLTLEELKKQLRARLKDGSMASLRSSVRLTQCWL